MECFGWVGFIPCMLTVTNVEVGLVETCTGLDFASVDLLLGGEEHFDSSFALFLRYLFLGLLSGYLLSSSLKKTGLLC